VEAWRKLFDGRREWVYQTGCEPDRIKYTGRPDTSDNSRQSRVLPARVTRVTIYPGVVAHTANSRC